MARITLHLDSATADEAREFVLAFQTTRELERPERADAAPTVSMMGVGWGVTTPPMAPERAHAMAATLADAATRRELDTRRDLERAADVHRARVEASAETTLGLLES